GAFPFAVPFNVSGNPAVSLPCGLAGGLPVGLQLVMPLNEDERLLDLAEDVEEAVAFDCRPMGEAVLQPAGEPASRAVRADEIVSGTGSPAPRLSRTGGIR
ncbi:MAG: amidase family protein, partial [Alphaproteobacteria bacterium]|nr:amidase family protein [Alphaproteobacteria bacterium]